MGEKGAELTGDATEAAELLVEGLAELGGVTSRKMFGGYGVFSDGTMFALVDSAGTAHLRVDETTVSAFEEAGSSKHSRMPYWSIPGPVLVDPAMLATWGEQALEVAKAKKK